MNTTEQTSSLPSAGGENGVKLLLKYFPDLTEEQRKQFAALYELYIDWNSKINVISRKDIENLYEHHVLHSLGIAQHVFHHFVWNLNFYRSHGIRGDIIYIIIKGDAVFVQIEVFRWGNISGRAVTHILECFVRCHFLVRHQLIPQQVGQCFL